LLAESALHIDEIKREDIAARIEHARKLVDDASSAEHRTKAEMFLHQLTTLEGAILPA
jgi:F-type H+-transporting ATPase subunit epsilon